MCDPETRREGEGERGGGERERGGEREGGGVSKYRRKTSRKKNA